MRQIAHFLVATTFTALAIAAWFDHGIGETVHPSGYVAYVGTYTRQQSRGIYAFRFDPAAGKAATVGWQARPKIRRFSPSIRIGRFLYASNRGHDSIAVFVIDRRNGTIIL